MKKLTVLMDAQCGFCWRCRGWLSRQNPFVELEFLSRESKEARRCFAALGEADAGDELIVVGDAGAVYRGPDAFIICLWALREYRELSLILASPAFRPLARKAFEIVSKRRGVLSRGLGWLGGGADQILEECRELPPGRS